MRSAAYYYFQGMWSARHMGVLSAYVVASVFLRLEGIMSTEDATYVLVQGIALYLLLQPQVPHPTKKDA